MVPSIEFSNTNDLPWPDLRTARLIEQGYQDGDTMDFRKYEIANVANTSTAAVKFLITIGHLVDANEFKRFMIQRIDNATKDG